MQDRKDDSLTRYAPSTIECLAMNHLDEDGRKEMFDVRNRVGLLRCSLRHRWLIVNVNVHDADVFEHAISVRGISVYTNIY